MLSLWSAEEVAGDIFVRCVQTIRGGSSMGLMTRRVFVALAASYGASLAWCTAYARSSNSSREEGRTLYPQGVASGDPHPESVILWTRRPLSERSQSRKLSVEIADDLAFDRVVASAEASLSADTNWTCRVLAAGLKPGHIYWYRFTDEHGFGSRVGRTITAPSEKDERPVRFAFVSCQNVQQGASTAYRRMIWEDEHRPVSDQLEFVLHRTERQRRWWPTGIQYRASSRAVGCWHVSDVGASIR